MMRKSISGWKDGPAAGAVILFFACALAFAPDAFLLMLARSFMVQWALLAAAIAVHAVFTRRWWSAGAAGCAAVLLGYPPQATVQADPDTDGKELVRVAQMNLFQPNKDHDDVLSAARATNADVISFQEVSPEWAEALEQGLATDYPFHRIVPARNCYGIALFSKLPFAEMRTEYVQGSPVLCAEVSTPAGPVRLLSVHATSPGSYAHFQRRNAQLDAIAGMVNHRAMPMVLFGDLNTVSWDRSLVRLCARTGLREHTDNLDATWPSFAGLALIPLDHIFVSNELAVAKLGTFTIAGSDHRGVMANIRLRT